MDPLSDLLHVVRLDGAHFYTVDAGDPWSVHALPARELAPRIMPHAEHLISYHIITRGRCVGGVLGEEHVELDAGDIIVFPHGDAHVMASGRGVRVADDLVSIAQRQHPNNVMLGEGERGTSLICGFFGCDLRPFNPLLETLPRRLHLRRMSSPWLDAFTRHLADETRTGSAGADAVLTRLAEVMFVEVLRRYLQELAPEQTGWLAGLRDPVAGRVLGLIHARPAHSWTLDLLAREVASSRSVVARRFAEIVGLPPMQYLTRWRMQLAASRLAHDGAKVAAVAADVGYDSEAAFSRAFKRATGHSPAAWRTSRRSIRS